VFLKGWTTWHFKRRGRALFESRIKEQYWLVRRKKEREHLITSFIFRRCYVDKDKEDEMGWTYSANVGDEKCMRILVGKP
jgi:hypothetical protein